MIEPTAVDFNDQPTPVILTKSERSRSKDAWKDPGNFSSAMLDQGVRTRQSCIRPFYLSNDEVPLWEPFAGYL
jgi:hypothetical protein